MGVCTDSPGEALPTCVQVQASTSRENTSARLRSPSFPPNSHNRRPSSEALRLAPQRGVGGSELHHQQNRALGDRDMRSPGQLKWALRLAPEHRRRSCQLQHRPVSIGTIMMAVAAVVSLDNVRTAPTRPAAPGDKATGWAAGILAGPAAQQERLTAATLCRLSGMWCS